jgi:hypothetical protein
VERDKGDNDGNLKFFLCPGPCRLFAATTKPQHPA